MSKIPRVGPKMIDEQLARLRVYANNIHRYRRLLKGGLADHERKFGLSEEQSAMLRLTTEGITIYEALPPTPETRVEEIDGPVTLWRETGEATPPLTKE